MAWRFGALSWPSPSMDTRLAHCCAWLVGLRETQGMAEQISQSELASASDTFYAALADALDGDATAMVDQWSQADDVCYLGPMGDLIVGGDAVQESWEQFAATHLGGKVTESELHFVGSGDIGIVTGWEKGVGHRGLDEPINIRATSTYRREGGVLKMIGHHTDLIVM